MQFHHCLPGARAAFDHQHWVIEPNDPVLLGLDRRDDSRIPSPRGASTAARSAASPRSSALGRPRTSSVKSTIRRPRVGTADADACSPKSRRSPHRTPRRGPRQSSRSGSYSFSGSECRSGRCTDVGLSRCPAGETQSVVGDVEPGDLSGQCAHRDVARHQVPPSTRWMGPRIAAMPLSFTRARSASSRV